MQVLDSFLLTSFQSVRQEVSPGHLALTVRTSNHPIATELLSNPDCVSNDSISDLVIMS